MICLFGFFGAICRYLIKNIDIEHYFQLLPLNTLIINIAGCFFISFVLTITLDTETILSDLRLGITTGFLGAFTTFSTVCKEVSNLMIGAHYLYAVSYIALSLAFGLTASYFGMIFANRLAKKPREETTDRPIKSAAYTEDKE